MKRIIIVLVFLLCTITAHAQYGEPLTYFTQEEMDWLARAVAGEVGVMGEHREQAGTWIVHVALNRVENRWFPADLVQVVRGGFWGALVWEEQIPPTWAYDVVGIALAERAAGNDPTAGSLFIFGGEAIIDCMDFSLRYGMLQREGWVFSVHLFLRWPYPEGCGY